MLGPNDHYIDGVGMIPTRPIAGDRFYWGWDAPTLAELRARLARGDSAPLETMVRQLCARRLDDGVERRQVDGHCDGGRWARRVMPLGLRA